MVNKTLVSVEKLINENSQLVAEVKKLKQENKRLQSKLENDKTFIKLKEVRNKYRRLCQQTFTNNQRVFERESNLKAIVYRLITRLIEISPEDDIVKDVDKIREIISNKL